MVIRRLRGFAVIASLSLPVLVHAQSAVVIRQDSCLTVDVNHVRVYFTVNNLSPNHEDLCSFTLTPDPLPASAECIITGFGSEGLWVGSAGMDGSVWFGVPPTEYPFGCVGHSASQGGFYIAIDPSGSCCYEARFANSTYQVWWTMTWCVDTCHTVPVERQSWGLIKSRYD